MPIHFEVLRDLVESVCIKWKLPPPTEGQMAAWKRHIGNLDPNLCRQAIDKWTGFASPSPFELADAVKALRSSSSEENFIRKKKDASILWEEIHEREVKAWRERTGQRDFWERDVFEAKLASYRRQTDQPLPTCALDDQEKATADLF